MEETTSLLSSSLYIGNFKLPKLKKFNWYMYLYKNQCEAYNEDKDWFLILRYSTFSESHFVKFYYHINLILATSRVTKYFYRSTTTYWLWCFPFTKVAKWKELFHLEYYSTLAILSKILQFPKYAFIDHPSVR